MTEREKIVKEFEHMINEAKGDYMDFVDLTVDFGEEILALLKEQEAVEPKIRQGSFWFQCSKCKSPINYGDKFCRQCGQAAKWK